MNTKNDVGVEERALFILSREIETSWIETETTSNVLIWYHLLLMMYHLHITCYVVPNIDMICIFFDQSRIISYPTHAILVCILWLYKKLPTFNKSNKVYFMRPDLSIYLSYL